jgi:hypothetical protein
MQPVQALPTLLLGVDGWVLRARQPGDAESLAEVFRLAARPRCVDVAHAGRVRGVEHLVGSPLECGG